MNSKYTSGDNLGFKICGTVLKFLYFRIHILYMVPVYTKTAMHLYTVCKLYQFKCLHSILIVIRHKLCSVYMINTVCQTMLNYLYFPAYFKLFL